MHTYDFKTALTPTILDTPLNRLNGKSISVDPRYIVKGIMMPGQVGMIFGPSNVGKSTVVASICAHIAQGLPLADVQTQKSLVLYIAAEDPKGVEDRALPHLLNVPSDAHSFYVFPKAVDLTDTDQMGRLAYEIADLMEAESASSCLVVFDTMAMSIGDGDENSSRDMARVIQNLRRLAEGTGILGTSEGPHPVGFRNRERCTVGRRAGSDNQLVVSVLDLTAIIKEPHGHLLGFAIDLDYFGARNSGEALGLIKEADVARNAVRSDGQFLET